MAVQMRLSGDPAEIEVMVKVLAVVFQLDGSGHFFTNHGTAGVRCYLTAHIPHGKTSEKDQHR